MTRWTYGDAWEKFPIQAGEIWQAGSGRVVVHDITQPLPALMKEADCLFIDPPWNLGNLNSFYTKAGRDDYHHDFGRFADIFFQRVAEVAPATCYIEIGNQNVTDWTARLQALFPIVQQWPVVYYRKHPTNIIRGSFTQTSLDMTGMDEADCIKMIAFAERYTTIGDLCMGRGLVGVAAHKAGRPFVGTELNPRRLACLLDHIARLGGEVCRL